MLTNSTSKYICWFDPWWEQDFYFTFMLFLLLCLTAILPTQSSRRDLCSPSCKISVLQSHLHICDYLSFPPSWQGVPCPFQQPTHCQQTHFAQKVRSQDLLLLSVAMRKNSCTKQTESRQPPSVSLPPQCTMVPHVSGNISGSPGLRYRQCLTPYLPQQVEHRHHL